MSKILLVSSILFIAGTVHAEKVFQAATSEALSEISGSARDRVTAFANAKKACGDLGMEERYTDFNFSVLNTYDNANGTFTISGICDLSGKR